MNYLSKYKNKGIEKTVTIAQSTRKNSVLRDFCLIITSVILAFFSIVIIKEIARNDRETQVPTINYDVFENGGKDA